MNINDFDISTIPEDIIGNIFEQQESLITKYDVIERGNGFFIPDSKTSLDNSFLQARVKDFFWRTTEEIVEALEDVPQILTTNTSVSTIWTDALKSDSRVQHFFEELSDALHFMVEVSIIAQMDLFVLRQWIDCRIGIKGSQQSSFGSDIELESDLFEVIQFLGLAANTLKNKPWKQSQMKTDREKFFCLLHNAWKSFLLVWNFLGCGQNEIYILYAKKNQVNQFRQETKY